MLRSLRPTLKPLLEARIGTNSTFRKSKLQVRMSSISDITPYQLSFYVPKPNTSTVLTAIHKTGAGTYPGGIYGECAFIISGTGTFRPLDGANPVIGKVGDVEKVDEDKVEVMCVGKDCMERAVQALKETHPYEQVAYFVLKGENV